MHSVTAWVPGLLRLPVLTLSRLTGQDATARSSGLSLCVLLGPVFVVAVVRSPRSPVAHTLPGQNNPALPLYLWSLPRSVQLMYAGACVFCLVFGGTDRFALGTAALLSLLSSFLVLMRASAAAATART